MYICNCNAINQRQIKAAIDAGAVCYRDVLGHHGCVPQCGKCQTEIDDAISSPKQIKSVSLIPECMPLTYVGA